MSESDSLKEAQTFRRHWHTFSEQATVHGVSYLADSKTKIIRFFWLIIILAALCSTGYFGYKVIKEFMSRPYTTKVDLITRTSVDFPAVTICNMNRLRRSKLPNTRFESLIDIDGGLDLEGVDYDWFFDWDEQWKAEWDVQYGNVNTTNSENPPKKNERRKRDTLEAPDHANSQPTVPRRRRATLVELKSYFYDYGLDIANEHDWRGFYEKSKADDFSDIIDIINPTEHELAELGHQARDFIIQCTFDKRSCDFT